MPMKIGTQMPSFEGATEWFNATGAAAAAAVKGSPTLVHFWALSCGICKENLPRVAEWRDRHAAEGLKVVAVHMPRYEADTDAEAVRDAVTTCGITEPCAIDNQHRLRDAFENKEGYVPAYYLFDAEGKLRCFAAGERGIDMLKSALERVLGESSKGGGEEAQPV